MDKLLLILLQTAMLMTVVMRIIITSLLPKLLNRMMEHDFSVAAID
jgi:hypothetical protein